MIEYKQIPMMSGGKCCLCKRKLQQRKLAVIYVYDDEMNSQKTTAELFYCPSCMVQYANSDIFTHIRISNNGYRAFGFMATAKLGRTSLVEKATTAPVYCGENKKKLTEHPHQGFKVYPTNKNGRIVNFHVVSEVNDACVICNKKLLCQGIPIPISKTSCVHYTGKGCGEHFLLGSSKKLWQLLNGNPYAKQIKINTDYFFKNYLSAKRIFAEDKSYSILLLMKPKEKGHKTTNELAIIVGDKRQQVHSDIIVIDYKDDETRQLLADIFKHDKKEVDYSGVKYRVYYKKTQDLDVDLILDSVEISPGGGYRDSIKSARYQIIDVLMYSPYTQKYEVVHATYDSMEYMCFIDVSIFRSFVSRYGNPGIAISFPDSRGIYSDFLNEESLLHIFGYTVNQQDKLSDGERCAILAYVIDLELMQPQAIVRFLGGCAKRAKGKCYYQACAKYEHDIEFVANYKVNPQRFLIAGY